MNAQDVLEVLDRTAWDAPFTADEQARAVEALEAGRVVCLPHLAFHIAASKRNSSPRTRSTTAARTSVSTPPPASATAPAMRAPN